MTRFYIILSRAPPSLPQSGEPEPGWRMQILLWTG